MADSTLTVLKPMNLLGTTAILLATLLSACSALASNAASECIQHFDNAEYDRAVAVCKQAAGEGDAPSQTVLGEMYDSGQGVRADAERARHWWNAAAAQAFLPAQNLLASKYYYGGEIFEKQAEWPQDYSKAFELWKQSAYKGAASSQFMLGVMYKDGNGVERDDAEAYAWMKIALEGGYKLATDVLIELSRRMTPQQKHDATARVDALKSQIDQARPAH